MEVGGVKKRGGGRDNRSSFGKKEVFAPRRLFSNDQPVNNEEKGPKNEAKEQRERNRRHTKADHHNRMVTSTSDWKENLPEIGFPFSGVMMEVENNFEDNNNMVQRREEGVADVSRQNQGAKEEDGQDEDMTGNTGNRRESGVETERRSSTSSKLSLTDKRREAKRRALTLRLLPLLIKKTSLEPKGKKIFCKLCNKDGFKDYKQLNKHVNECHSNCCQIVLQRVDDPAEDDPRNNRRRDINHETPPPVLSPQHQPAQIDTVYDPDPDRNLGTVPKLLPEVTVAVEKMKLYECSICGKLYSSKKSLRRHFDSAHLGKRFKCEFCKREFGRVDNYRAHLAKYHSGEKIH